MSQIREITSRIKQRLVRSPGAPPAHMSLETALEIADDEDDDLLRACENFMGARGGNPDQQEAYRARAMEDLIADPDVPEARKEQLRAALKELSPKPLLGPETKLVPLAPEVPSLNGRDPKPAANETPSARPSTQDRRRKVRPGRWLTTRERLA